MPKSNKDRSYSVQDEEKADQEMREKDKCLENGDQSDEGNGRQTSPAAAAQGGPRSNKASVKKTCFQELREQASGHKPYVVIVLLCLVVLVFFIVILVLAVQIGYLRTNDSHITFCDSPSCLRSASGVSSHLNSSVDPCQDFWSYACGGWLAENPLPERLGSWSVADELRQKINWRLRHQIDLVPHDTDIRDPGWKVKRFYEVCMDVGTNEYSAPATLTKTINALGGWALLNNWTRQRWNKDSVLKRLHVEFGVTPYFKVVVGPDDKAPTTNVIQILPDGLGLPSPHHYFIGANNKFKDMYKTFLDHFARELGATASDSSIFAENIYGHETRIAQVTPGPEAHRNPEKYYKRLTVQELSSVAPTIPWLELLQLYFPSANVKDLTQIAIFDEEYFRSLSAIVSSTDSLTMHHYFMWQLSLRYAKHLSSAFRNLANRFHQALEGVENPNLLAEDHWEYCLKTANVYLGNALGAIYVKSYFSADDIMETEVVENQIITAFINHAGSVLWADDTSTVEALREKIKSMLSLRGYPEYIFNSDALADFYNDYDVQGDFMQNLFDGEKFIRRKHEDLLARPVSTESSWTISPLEVSALYQYTGNHLVIAAGLLQPPLFDSHSSNAIKCGSLGNLLGSQIFKAFDEKGIAYQKLGALSPWLEGRSAALYERESTCLKADIEVANEHARDSQINANLTLGEAISDLAALKYAYQAYKNVPDDHQGLPGVSESNEELFFISYAQSMCQNIRAEKVHNNNYYKTTSHNQVRVLRALRQFPEFSKTFRCSSNSPMNPNRKCSMW